LEKYLVTGGAGFIGSHIVRELVRREKQVRVLDNLSTGKLENIRGLQGVEFIRGDIRDEAACASACEGVEYVLHQAAFISVPKSIEEPLTTNEINVNGTLNLLEAAKDREVKRFVYAGTCAVYGNGKESLSEGHPIRPLSPYAATKSACELFAEVFTHCFGLASVGLRYFNVFGPRQDPGSEYAAVIPKFIAGLAAGKPPLIHGDGLQTRDFIFIDDVVSANLLACTTPLTGHNLINVGSGKSTSVNELADHLIELFGSDLRPSHGPERPGDIRHSGADIGRMKKLLGFVPEARIREGLKKTVRWFREER